MRSSNVGHARTATVGRRSRVVLGSSTLLLGALLLGACTSSSGGGSSLFDTTTSNTPGTVSTLVPGSGGTAGTGTGPTAETGNTGVSGVTGTGDTGFGNSGNTGTSNPDCSLGTVTEVTGESTSTQQQQMSSWTTIQADNWTAFVPSGDWHLSDSDAGVNVISPDGSAEASDDSYSQQTPWSFSSLGSELGGISNIDVICRSTASSSASTTEVSDLTADYQGAEIRGIFSLTIVTPTVSDLFQADVRFIYAPAGDWSASLEGTLLLVMLNAIEVPQAP